MRLGTYDMKIEVLCDITLRRDPHPIAIDYLAREQHRCDLVANRSLHETSQWTRAECWVEAVDR